MEDKIISDMEIYIQKVEALCELLLNGINNQYGVELKNKKDFFEFRNNGYINEFNYNGVKYNMHGIGCTALSNTEVIHWDFGYRSRWCGIDVWKVIQSKFNIKLNSLGNYSGKQLEQICDDFVQKGKMIKIGKQYYILEKEQEKYIPRFPDEFDTLVIVYRDNKWSVSRNKLINKFIRKSNIISKKINERIDNYQLVFLDKGKTVFEIAYNDYDYPENAVKIMSDQIITQLEKGI